MRAVVADDYGAPVGLDGARESHYSVMKWQAQCDVGRESFFRWNWKRIPMPNPTEPALSVVVPVYNEVDNLRELCRQILAVAEAEAIRLEVILVNDGSTDGSRELLDELAAQDTRIKVVHFVRNYGQTAAMSAGFKLARGRIVVTLDADLQNDPADIPALLRRLDEGYDVVCGWRKNRKDPLLTRKIPSIIANKIISVTSKVPLHDYGCTLRAYRREFLEDLPLYGEMHRFIPIYVTWAGARLTEMPVHHRPRTRGRSKYGLSRVFKVMLDLVTVKFLRDYYVNPIYFFGYFGFLLGFLGVLSIGAAVFMKVYYGTWMHKNPFVIFSVMFFIMALVMFSMGLITEVLIRMNFEIQKKPPYKVLQMVNFDPDRERVARPIHVEPPPAGGTR